MTYSRTSILSVDFPEEKIDEIRGMFDLFDRDGTGTIATRDLGLVMRAVGLTPTEAEVSMLMLRLDTERKGSIELVDFVEMASNVTNAAPDARTELLRALSEFDHNGDGHISSAEFRHVMTNLGEKVTDEDLEELSKEMDISTSGSLNCKELADKLLSS